VSNDDVLTRLTTALADRYRIDRELGAGGMAIVFRARPSFARVCSTARPPSRRP